MSDFDSPVSAAEMESTFQKRVFARRKQEITKASLFLFADKGCFNFRVEDVAERAGVAKGSIYNHFRSKEEMLRAAFEELQLSVIAEYEDRLRDLPGEAARLSKLIIVAEILLKLDCRIVSLFKQLPCSLANLGQEDIPHPLENLVVSVIEESLPDRSFPPTSLADLFVGIVINESVRSMAHRTGVPQTAQFAVNFFLRGAYM